MRIAALLLLLLVVAPSSLAQQNRSLVRDASVQVIFPQAIQFWLDLTVTAADVNTVELKVTAGDGAEITFAMTPQTAALVFDEPEARLRYNWIFTPDQTPHWYDVISYEWSFTLLDGRAETRSGEFVFSDPHEVWSASEDANGNYRVILPRRLVRTGLDVSTLYEQFRRNTGTSPRISWVIYPSNLDPGCIRTINENEEEIFTATGLITGYTLPCVPESLDWVMQGWDLQRLIPEIPSDQMVARWLVDVFYRSAWSGKNVPDWFKEGLALFYSTSSKSVLLSTTRESVRTRRTLSAQQMRIRQDSQEWQAQSYGMIAYIVDQIGVLGLFRLANLIASTDFVTAYRQMTGQEVETLNSIYERWIFSREADAAFGVTPYQPPSPTPSPTFTATDTATFTPTATFTITPTPTVTGVLTRTTAPTITLLPSRTLPPPTVTPRPPGSLQTPTPIPTPQVPSILEQPTIRIGSFVVLAVLLVVLIVLLIRSGGKR